MELWPLISAGAIIALELLKNNGSSLSWATIQRTELFFLKVVCHRDLSHFLSNLCWNFFSGRQSSFEENKHPSSLHTWILIFVVAWSSACSLTVHGIFDSLSANFVLGMSDRACPAVCSVENWLCGIWRLLKTTAVKRLLPYSFTQYYPVFSSVKSSVSLPAFCPLISRFINFTYFWSSRVVLSSL